jgi:hypothetical protein
MVMVWKRAKATKRKEGKQTKEQGGEEKKPASLQKVNCS